MAGLYQESAQFRCCFYLHVRIGTIIVGILHILLQLIVVSTLLMAALKHDGVLLNKSPFNNVGYSNCQQKEPPSDLLFMMMHIVPGFTIFHKSHSDMTSRFQTPKTHGIQDFDETLLKSQDNGFLNFLIGGTPSPLKAKSSVVNVVENGKESEDFVKKESSSLLLKYSSPFAPPNCTNDGRHANPYFSLCLALISLAVGYLLVHGVISRQPAHLLPFFCLQVFDFVVAIICMLGYISSASDFRHWLKEKDSTKMHMGPINPTSIALLMVSTSCLILAFKAYCIGMVWDCHRYLLLVTNRRGVAALTLIPRLPFFLGGMFRRPYSPTATGGTEASTRAEETADPIADLFVGELPPSQPPADSELPKYEEALSTPANAYAPPPYFAKSSKLTVEHEGPLPSKQKISPSE